MTFLETLCAGTQTLAKAKRLSFCINLLQQNRPEYEIRKRVQQHYHCSRATAWRMVDNAKDLV